MEEILSGIIGGSIGYLICLPFIKKIDKRIKQENLKREELLKIFEKQLEQEKKQEALNTIFNKKAKV